MWPVQLNRQPPFRCGLLLAVVALLALGALLGAQASSCGDKGADKPLRVLFVGNSYTYENNLPFVFKALADPLRRVEVSMVAAGGATLRRHIDAGKVLKTIGSGDFDVIVAQEQSEL